MKLYANHKEAYAVASGNDQAIYQLGSTLAMPQNPKSTRTVEQLCQDYASRWLKFSTQPDKLGSRLADAGIDVTLLGHEGSIAARHVTSTITKRVANTIITLQDPLEELVAEQPLQLGIVTNRATKVLYPPDTRLIIPPSYAKDAFHQDKNARWYERVTNALEAHDAKALKHAIDGYLNEDYHVLDRAFFAVKETIKTYAPTLFSPKKRSEDEARANDFVKPSNRMIITVRAENASAKKACASFVRHYVGSDCVALESSETLILRNDPKEFASIMRNLQTEHPPQCEFVSMRPARQIVVPLPKPVIGRRALGSLEHVTMLNAYAAHKVTRGKGVTVAIMDSGVDYTHPALASRFDGVPGFDFVKNTDEPMDEHGHGTHVAGIVASIAPEVKLKAVRVLDKEGMGSEADILLGYEYCYRNRIPIINCSFGGYQCSDEERAIIECSREYGALIIAAAGNESSSAPSFPASVEGVLSIASVNRTKEHSGFSNTGYVDFAALGENVQSTLPDGGYGTMTGTSMASPCVAGAFALQKAVRNESIDDRVLVAASRCQKAAGPSARYEEWFGHGIPDCARWVE
ncbi:S8 family serine peptidase [Candidatus Woesearchaeota archaeon]|nr:S8 family serine peptidase [Candidatus Woesearchaeota archaeon]